MKDIARTLILAISRNSLIRRLFLSLPLQFRLSIRRLVVPKGNFYEPSSANYKALANEIALNATPSALAEPTQVLWSTVGFNPSIGDAELATPKQTHSEAEYVTIDFWDTLVARVRPAEAAKRMTAMRFSLMKWQLMGFHGDRDSAESLHLLRLDSEAKQVMTHGEASASKAIASMARRQVSLDSTIEKLVELEVEDEIRFSRLLESVFSHDLLVGKTLNVVSDFYSPGRDLRSIFDSFVTDHKIEEFFTSADLSATKRNGGALFTKLGLHHKSSWLHVGDSDHSDIKMAENKGANSLKVTRAGTTSWNLNDLNAEDLATDLKAHLRTDDAGKFALDVALLGSSLVSFAIETALKLGKTQILYVSREGATLSNIHKYISPELSNLGLPELRPLHIPCSRASLFFPSFGHDLQAGLDQLALQYPVLTRDALVETLGLPTDIAGEVGVSIGKFQRIRTVKALSYLEPETIAKIETYLHEQSRLFREMLNQIGVDLQSSIVCDLGWRGTINDSISRIAGFEIPGVYLGLHAPLSSKAHLLNKTGLLFDEVKGVQAPPSLGLLGPIERAFTLSSASVIGYECRGNLVHPVQSEVPDPPSLDREAFMKSNLEATSRVAAPLLFSCGFFGKETRTFVGKIVSDWMSSPNEFHASTWFDEVHGEGFGTSEVHYSNVRPSEKWFGSGAVGEINKALVASLWPQGYLSWRPLSNLLRSRGGQ